MIQNTNSNLLCSYMLSDSACICVSWAPIHTAIFYFFIFIFSGSCVGSNRDIFIILVLVTPLFHILGKRKCILKKIRVLILSVFISFVTVKN